MNGVRRTLSAPGPRRVGYYLTEKKSKKLNFAKFAQHMQSAGVEMELIDLSKSVDEQPHFDVIVHKLTDLMTAADGGDKDAAREVALVEEYIARHPKVVVLDPLANVRKLLDRSVCYREIEAIQFDVRGIRVCSPDFVTVDSSPDGLNESKLAFPVVCKHLIAHGSRLAHRMAIVFSGEGLKEIDFFPFVAQKFINHSGLLYKIFVVGKKHFTVKRPSVKNLGLNRTDQSTIFFDSHDVSKADSSSELNVVLDSVEDHRRPDEKVFADIAAKFREKLGLSLFGIDVLIEDNTNRHCIIDVNFFPGYEGYADFDTALEDLFLSQLPSAERAGNGFVANGYQNGKLPHHYSRLTGQKLLLQKNGFHPLNGDLDDPSRKQIAVSGQIATAATLT